MEPRKSRNVAQGSFGLPEVRKTWPDVLRFLGVACVLQLLVVGGVTQWLADKLEHQHALGAPLVRVVGYPVYSPLAFRTWGAKLAETSPGAVLPQRAQAAATVGTMLNALLMLWLLSRKRRQWSNRAGEVHGSARFANESEIRRSGLLKPGGVIIGSWLDPAKKLLRYLWHNGPEHLLMFAPNRSGKGVGVVIPTLCTWRHSLLCLDIKDENYRLTSGHRRKFSRVMRLNWGATPGTVVCFNPLSEVRVGTPYEIRDVELVCDTLLPDGGQSDSTSTQHFLPAAKRLVSTAILHALYRAKSDKAVATLRQVGRELATAPTPQDMVEDWLSYPYPVEGGEWFTEEGKANLLTTARALDAFEGRRLSVLKEQAVRSLTRFVHGLSEQRTEAPVHLAGAGALGLAEAEAMVAEVLDYPANTPADLAGILRASLLQVAHECARGGNPTTWEEWLAMLKGEKSPFHLALIWRHYPHDPEDEWVSHNGIQYIREGAGQQLGRDQREAAGVLSTAQKAFFAFADENVARNSSRSDFAIQDLVHGERPTTLYLATTPAEVKRLRPLLSLFVAQAMVRLTETLPTRFVGDTQEEATSRRKTWLPRRWMQTRTSSVPDANSRHRMLCLLDELPALGRIPALEEAMPVCAGYGIKLFIIVQQVRQLTRVYGANCTIFGEAHVRLAYAPNDPDTAELLSKMTGRTTVELATSGSSQRAGGLLASASLNQGEQQVGRPLLDPAECGRLGATRTEGTQVVEPGQMLVFLAGMHPILASKVQYYADRAMLLASQCKPEGELPAPNEPQSNSVEHVAMPETRAITRPQQPDPGAPSEELKDIMGLLLDSHQSEERDGVCDEEPWSKGAEASP